MLRQPDDHPCLYMGRWPVRGRHNRCGVAALSVRPCHPCLLAPGTSDISRLVPTSPYRMVLEVVVTPLVAKLDLCQRLLALARIIGGVVPIVSHFLGIETAFFRAQVDVSRRPRGTTDPGPSSVVGSPWIRCQCAQQSGIDRPAPSAAEARWCLAQCYRAGRP